MSETYEFPDEEDVPTIKTKRDDFEFPETKTLFLKYDDAEWSEENITETAQTINCLFGTDVQIALLSDSLEFLTKDDIEGLLDG